MAKKRSSKTKFKPKGGSDHGQRPPTPENPIKQHKKLAYP